METGFLALEYAGPKAALLVAIAMANKLARIVWQCSRAIKITESQAERSAEGRRSNWNAGDLRRT